MAIDGEGAGAASVETAPMNDVGVNWSDMADDSSSSSEVMVETPAVETPSTPVATPEPAVQQPAQQPEAQQPQAVPPQTQQVQQPPVEQPPVAQQPPVDMQAWQQQQFEALRNHYTLQPADALRLQTEPELVLPELAASLHMQVVANIQQQMPQLVGQLIQSHLQFSQKETTAKNEFFTAWPELQNYEAQVRQVGAMVRAANPGMTKDQAIQRIGQVVMASLGLTRAQPVQAQPSAPIQPASFTPAGVGGSPTGMPPQQQNMWAELASDD